MELLWLALPMVGCAVMMVFMMGMGASRSPKPPSERAPDERRTALEEEARSLRAELGEREDGRS